MKILIISHEFPPYLGGVGSVAAQLARFLVNRSIEVHVVTRSQPGRLDIPGVVFHDVPVLPKLWFLSYKRFFRQFDLEAFDGIVLNEAAPTIVAGKYFTQTHLEKSLVLVHGLEVETLYRPTQQNWLRQLFGFKSAHERACLLSRGVAVASKDIRQKFIEANHWPETQKIHVKYLGADADTFFLEPSDFRRQRDLSDSDFLLVSGSRIVSEKGYGQMLQTFAQLVQHQPNLKWVVCGDGDYLNELTTSASALGVADHILFEGSCSKEALRKIYNDCDLFWLISNYREAFPLAYIEAQLTGLPTIGRDYGGVREAISEHTGWLVNNADDVIPIITEYIENESFEKTQVAEQAQRFAARNTLPELLSTIAPDVSRE